MEEIEPLDKILDLNEVLVHLSRLGLQGKSDDIKMYLRRITRKLRIQEPELAGQLQKLTRSVSQRDSVLRDASVMEVPVDLDSRLELIQCEHPVLLEHEPIWPEGIRSNFEQFVAQRKKREELASHGLAPSRSLLLTGPPGVGKTLGSRWIARELSLPLFVLDLSAVMSSFLGRTGNNLRAVLDYAKSVDCVLLLDEFDAIAKRRDDATEIGELKRLVTVLLQEIDKWPEDGILIAATNHAELLDTAVWRRFDTVLKLDIPEGTELREAIRMFLYHQSEDIKKAWIDILSVVLEGHSYSDIGREVLAARRFAAISSIPLCEAFEQMVPALVHTRDRSKRKAVAMGLLKNGLSQRRVSELTGVSRDTLRAASQGGRK